MCIAYMSRKGYPSLPEDNQGKVILHNSRDCHFQVTFGDHSECPQNLYNDIVYFQAFPCLKTAALSSSWTWATTTCRLSAMAARMLPSITFIWLARASTCWWRRTVSFWASLRTRSRRTAKTRCLPSDFCPGIRLHVSPCCKTTFFSLESSCAQELTVRVKKEKEEIVFTLDVRYLVRPAWNLFSSEGEEVARLWGSKAWGRWWTHSIAAVWGEWTIYNNQGGLSGDIYIF